MTTTRQDARVLAFRRFSQQPVTPATFGRKVIASLATLAFAGGLMGMGTVGDFDNSHDKITRSTTTHPQ